MEVTKAATSSHPVTSLHDVVLDYITTHAFASTAKILSRPRSYAFTSTKGLSDELSMDDTGEGSSSREAEKRPKRARDQVLDQDSLQSIERRRVILNYILNGAIIRAVEALNSHFTSVLDESFPSSSTTTGAASEHTNGHSTSPSTSYTNGHSHRPLFSSGPVTDHSLPVFPHSHSPSHVRLNLQIQQFIESFRQLAPSSPSSPSSSISSLTSSMHVSNTTTTNGSSVTLTHALTAAQGLHSEAKKLPPDVRAVYLQEIKDVGALFAYTEPETSILKGFLQQSRRIALAEQVNRAILRSEGRAPQSQLEMYARRTTAIYSIMRERDIDPRPPWTGADGQGKEQLATFWKQQTGVKTGFRLREYVSHTWG